MNTRKIATEYRLAKWAQKVQARQESGQSVKDYCAAEGISRNIYFYWQRKVREAVCSEYGLQAANKETELIPSGWAKLKTTEVPEAHAGVMVEISGYRVLATAETDTELLAKIFRMLKTI